MTTSGRRWFIRLPAGLFRSKMYHRPLHCVSYILAAVAEYEREIVDQGAGRVCRGCDIAPGSSRTARGHPCRSAHPFAKKRKTADRPVALRRVPPRPLARDAIAVRVEIGGPSRVALDVSIATRSTAGGARCGISPRRWRDWGTSPARASRLTRSRLPAWLRVALDPDARASGGDRSCRTRIIAAEATVDGSGADLWGAETGRGPCHRSKRIGCGPFCCRVMTRSTHVLH